MDVQQKRLYELIIEAVSALRIDPTYGPRLTKKWLPADTWVEALRRSNLINSSFNIDNKKFNKAMSSAKAEWYEAMGKFDGTNNTGVFRLVFQRQIYYYVTDQSAQVDYPLPLDMEWKERILAVAENALVIPTTRSRPAFDENDTHRNEDGEPLASNKRQRTEVHIAPHITPCIATGQQVTYWKSSEARKLFSPIEGDEDAKDTLQRRIERLKSVNEKEDGWRDVIHGRDADNLCSSHDIFVIRQRSLLLCVAYQIALEKMNEWTWYACCQEACDRLNPIGITQATNRETVGDWNVAFRQFDNFPHPNPRVQCGKHPEPRLFEKFPEARDEIIAYGVQNLKTLTIETVQDFIITKLVPKLHGVWKEEEQKASEGKIDDKFLTLEEFLKSHGLATVGFSTVWRWLRDLGFSYCTRKKSFYVDGHEREDVVAYRLKFCKLYLTVYEPRCLRWVQLPEAEAQAITGVDIEFGYSYCHTSTDTQWIEFHVDYCRKIPQLLQGREAKMSVRAPPGSKPLMIVGQDESVFAQFLLGERTWVGPKGERPLLPKSEGDGYMLSAFVSRDFGFGRPLTEAELASINAEQHGKQYLDTVAAKEIHKNVDKPPLTESPFVRYLYIGANNEGYWNSYHMALQFEDVVDCCKVLYPDFDFLFLFDHSQGHARKKEGALDASKMSRHSGGAQPSMRETKIHSVQGFLGPHEPQLEVGSVQSMVFKPTDSGPWYLSENAREAQRHDLPTGGTKRMERTKQQLIVALEGVGVKLQRNHTKKELQQFAQNNGIDLFVDQPDISQGWEGRPKGLLQVLWERGWIDPDKPVNWYTLDGRKDQAGVVDNLSSLRFLMGRCQDFIEEETALQYLGVQLGVTVMLTPKFHAELAGEGVEYCWAFAKGYYRRIPLAKKRGRDNFKALVKDSTCPVEQLTRERIGKFAARARAYICTYYSLSKVSKDASKDAEDVEANGTVAEMQQLLYSEIERLMQDFKVHRCALDFDRGFVTAELKRKAE